MSGCFDVLESDYNEDIQQAEELEATQSIANNQIPANNLPFEILAVIFNYFVPPERSELRRVCKLWKCVMDNSVGTTIRIGEHPECDFYENDNNYHDEYAISKYHSPSIIKRVGIDYLIVGDIAENWKTCNSFLSWGRQLWDYIRPPKGPTPLPKFKSPSVVSSLCIMGQIFPYHLTHFLTELQWLKVFSIGFYSLQNLTPSQLESISIPHLEVLVVQRGLKMHLIRKGMTQDWELENISRNILAITRNHFPNLKYAAIDFVYNLNEGLEIAKAQLEFLQMHSSTIKTYNMEYSILLNDEFSSLLHAPEDHNDLLQAVNSLKQCQLQLTGFRVLPLPFPKLPFANGWTALASDQHCLTDFAIMGVCFTLDFLEKIINSNYKTLAAIFVWEVKLFDNLTNTVKQMDCTIFNKCSNLTKLAIRGWTVTLTISNLQNVDQLPKCLKRIDLRDLAIRTDDIRYIVFEMPCLETLELHFVGNKREMGMDITTLKEIIEQRKLKQVRLYRSVNGKLDTGIFNGDKDNPEFISELYGFVSIELGSNEYYIYNERKDDL